MMKNLISSRDPFFGKLLVYKLLPSGAMPNRHSTTEFNALIIAQELIEFITNPNSQPMAKSNTKREHLVNTAVCILLGTVLTYKTPMHAKC